MKLDLALELARLRQMTVNQLADQYAKLFGRATHTRNKAYLIKRIAWGLQAQEEGDISQRARERAKELANDIDLRLTHPQQLVTGHRSSRKHPSLKPGSLLVRQYKGRTIEVLVHKDGFEFDGQKYPSLTAVAKAVTGNHWNGRLFFGLSKRKEASA